VIVQRANEREANRKRTEGVGFFLSLEEYVKFFFADSRARSRNRRIVDEKRKGSVRTVRRNHVLSDRRLLISARETPRAFPISRSRHANFRPHRSSPRRGVSRRGPRDRFARAPAPRRTCVHLLSFYLPLFLFPLSLFPSILLNHPRSAPVSPLPHRMY